MELIYSSNYPDNLKVTFETLKEIHANLYSAIIGQLSTAGGECGSYSSTPLGEGYPFDYLLYAKESSDPTVQVLYALLENIQVSFEKVKELNKFD